MTEYAQISGLLRNRSALTLISGDLEAVFLPDHGMLGASLRHKGVEMLRRVEDLESAAARGSTAGIPLLHPWANRLSEPRYAVLGKNVVLDTASPLLHLDEHGLPMHGVPWPSLAWVVTQSRQDFVAARLDWSDNGLLAIFPFPHQMELKATLRPESLTIETTLIAGESSVPVSFGFHPYFGLPGVPRSKWHLELPRMRRLILDTRGIPTGDDQIFGGFSGELDENSFDDGFALREDRTTFSIAGAGCTINMDLLDNYFYAQVFAPKDKDYIALEPMTAPTSALTSGHGLRIVAPGEQFRATFRIRIKRA